MFTVFDHSLAGDSGMRHNMLHVYEGSIIIFMCRFMIYYCNKLDLQHFS